MTINPITEKLTENSIQEEKDSIYEASPSNLQIIREFCFEKWKDRSEEMNRGIPSDLSSSCKFTSLFVRQVLGGYISGNYDHQFCIIEDEVVDINSNCDDVKELESPYDEDFEFLGNPDHLESLNSCVPRVNQWIKEFNQKHLLSLDKKSNFVSQMKP